MRQDIQIPLLKGLYLVLLLAALRQIAFIPNGSRQFARTAGGAQVNKQFLSLQRQIDVLFFDLFPIENGG